MKVEINLKFHYSSKLFVVDQILRIGIFVGYLLNYCSLSLFILFQFLLFAVELYFYTKYQNKTSDEFLKYTHPEKYQDLEATVTTSEDISDVLAVYQGIFGFFFSFWFFYNVFSSHEWYIYILIFLLSLFGALSFLVSLIVTIRHKKKLGVLSYKILQTRYVILPNRKAESKVENVTSQYPKLFICEKLIGFGEVELDEVDQNDIKIAKIESEVKNINHRSEAWMLESVFLGGLAFSGFLTVASANLIGKEPDIFKNFLNHVGIYYSNCINRETSSWVTEIETNFFRADLLIVIMLLCLLSSVFFLLVLTLRLRLSGLSLSMDHLIRLLIILNSKEEELFNLNFQSEGNDFQTRRLEKIQKKIETALKDSEQLLKELKPVARIMVAYRNIAVFLFYCVLVISGFYFMPIVAFLILAFAVATQLFRLFETYSKIDKIKNLLSKH